MTTTIRAYKGLVTKRNDVALNWLQESAELLQRIEQEGVGAQCEQAKDITMDITTCEEYIDLLETSVTKLTKAFDSLQDATDEEEDQLDKYVENAQGTIMKLHAHRSQLKKWQTDITGSTHRAGTDAVSSPAVSKLPVIPIPTFTGKKWEWDNFWALFKANVHDQELTELQKFKYLLSSLSGEAKQSISRFFVSANNYEKAIQHLAKRYGDKSGIVRQLNRNLKSCTARGPSTLEQRQLWDKLAAIANQLEEHEQHLDNELTIDTFLEKFHVRIRREAMDKQLRSEEGNKQEWTLNQWLDAVDEVISREEQLNDRLSAESQQIKTPAPTTMKRGNVCECCGSKGHRWTTCPQIPTATQKKNFLLESNRWLNCGSNNHRVAGCFSGNCRNCNKKHHTAICSEKRPSEMTQCKPPISQQKKPEGARTSKNQPTTAESCSSSKQYALTEALGREAQDTAQEATKKAKQENPSVLSLQEEVYVGSLSGPPSNDKTARNAVAPNGKRVMNGLKRQATSTESSISYNVQPPDKRSPIVIASATISKDKCASLCSEANLSMHPSVDTISAEAHMKSSIMSLAPFNDSDTNDDAPFTEFTAKYDDFMAKPDLSRDEFASKNEGKTIHKAWKELLDFREDVKRQQQQILDSIQRMSQYFETFEAWGMKNGTHAIQQEIQEENPKAQYNTTLAEQQSSKLARKERAKVRRRHKKQSKSEEKRTNIPAAPTLPQKGEECKRIYAKCKRKHTQTRVFSRNGKEHRNVAQRQLQIRKIEQNSDYLSCTRRRTELNVNREESHKQPSDACLKLRAGTRKIDVEHRKNLEPVASQSITEDRSERASCFYCRNIKGDAFVLNHHAIICRLLEEIAHKQRKLMRQAKTVEDNMKMISKRALVWNKKKRTCEVTRDYSHSDSAATTN